MEELQKLLSDTYYTLVVMVALQIVTTIIVIMNRKKFVELKYFHFYSMAGLFQTVITIVSLLLFNQELKSKLIEFSVNIFLLIEFLLIYHLFFQIILIKKLRNILKLFFVSFLIYVVFMWYFTDAFYKRSPKLFPIETVVILFPTVLFFLQL